MPILIVVLYLVIAAVGLTSLPLWWDEGWNLLVAQTTVDRGHYGAVIDGSPAPVGFCGSLSTVVPGIVGRALIGFEPWQMRLPYAAIAALALLSLYRLFAAVWNPRIAQFAFVVMALTAWQALVNPALLGIQALAELTGVLWFSLALRLAHRAFVFRTPWLLYGAGVFMALALFAKMQFLLFGLVAGIALIAASLAQGKRWAAIHTCGGWLVCAVVQRGLWRLEFLVRPTHQENHQNVLHNLSHIILNVDLERRIFASEALFELCAPTLFALLYCGVLALQRAKTAQGAPPSAAEQASDAIAFVIRCFAVAWFVWYGFVSVAYLRYLAIPLMLSSPFVAITATELWSRAWQSIRARQPGLLVRGVTAILYLALLVNQATATTLTLLEYPRAGFVKDYQQTVDYLSSAVFPKARVETYDIEILQGIRQPYHFPPDFIDQNAPTVMTDEYLLKVLGGVVPDVLVVGPMGVRFDAYRRIIGHFGFHPSARFGRYEVYLREGRTASSGE